MRLHEGYSGETIEWLANNVAAGAATAADPDIILLWAGTNDFFCRLRVAHEILIAMRMRRLLIRRSLIHNPMSRCYHPP